MYLRILNINKVRMMFMMLGSLCALCTIFTYISEDCTVYIYYSLNMYI